MPLGKAVPNFLLALLAAAAVACSTAPSPMVSTDTAPAAVGDLSAPTARMPREIQFDGVDMVIQRVESEVSRAEVAATIGPMIASAPACLRWPALWMEHARRTSFVVRYDLMVRDWSAPVAADAEARMGEFVEMGFLQRQAGENPQIVTYTITERGFAHLDGQVEPGARPSFCGPAERRLVAIEDMEWGRFACGTLRVRFGHDGDAWPSWLSSEAARARLAPVWPAAGAVLEGSVSLSRQWFSRQNLPPGAQNGGLRSACYDERRRGIVGDDLNLSIALSN